MLGVIDFIGPAMKTDDGGILFCVKGDGIIILCRFSAECLEDANPSLCAESAHEQFEASKAILLRVAEQKITAGEIADGVVWIFTRDL